MNIDLITILLWPMGGALNLLAQHRMNRWFTAKFPSYPDYMTNGHLVISGVLALAGPIGWFVGLIHLAVATVWILTEPLQGNVPPVRRWWNKRVRA